MTPTLINRPVVISLPFPVSANNLFINVPKRGRVTSSRYELWKADAGAELLLQKPAHLQGEVSVTVSLCPATKRRHDGDNLMKCVLDLLVSFRVIEGDDNRFVKAGGFVWRNSGPPCLVTISPYVEPVEVAA